MNFSQIIGYPHDLHDKSYKRFPKFNGEGVVTTKDHLLEFWTMCIELKVNYLEDVMMRLFVSMLEGNASKWYTILPNNSMFGYDELESTFLEECDVLLDNKLFLNQLFEMKKENESVYEFNQRFNSLLSKMPYDVKPSPLATTLHYLGHLKGHLDS